MFDSLSIRTKLIGIVAAPLLVTLIIAGLGFVDRRSEAADTRRDLARMEAVDAVAAVQHAIQLETLYSVDFLVSDETEVPPELIAQRKKTDQAAAAMAEAMKGVPDKSAVAASDSVVRSLEQTDASLRPQVDAKSLDWTWAESLYRNVLAGVPTITNRLVDSIEDGDLARGAEGVVALTEYTSNQARIGSVLTGVAAEGRFPEVSVGGSADDGGESARQGFDEALAEADRQLAVISAQAGPQVRTQLRNRMVGGDIGYFTEAVENVAALDDPAAPVSIDGERWAPAVEATLAQLRGIASEQVAEGLDTAAARADAAVRASQLYLVGAAIALMAAVGLAVYVATSIARPVISLTAAADQVATEQLPRLVEALKNPNEDDLEHLRPTDAAMDVGGGPELERLSRSVSAIQDMAVTVATEQADLLRKGIGDMFVNLARRNQALLDRQLEFIDELEAQEDDPDQLEHLFKLDHMATRMRRNAESLLVLAGAEPSRRRGNPVPMSKVSLAAVGEIEHFARVDLLDVDEVEVVSNAAADIAHLLSELMENATQFSPPDARVEVVGHRTAGSYTVSISDEGIGMSGEQLAEANALLVRPPLLGLTLARTLGFIVVGRLAARHGITVRLVASPAGGVTAIVTLPATLLVTPADRLDLTRRAPAAPTGPEPVPSARVDTPSSILPPFEYYSGPIDEPEPSGPEPVPATFAEAVPSGSALEEELSQVRAMDEPASVPSASSANLLTGPEPLPDDMVAPTARANPLFGPTDRPAPAGPAGAAPLPTRSTDGPRLFGAAPDAAPTAPTAPAALPTRQRGATAPSPTPGAADAVAAEPEVTSAGLVKRVPRRAGGVRAVPGSDGTARAATTTSTRSPEEVRAMLSRFHTGKQRAGLPTASEPDHPNKDT